MPSANGAIYRSRRWRSLVFWVLRTQGVALGWYAVAPLALSIAAIASLLLNL